MAEAMAASVKMVIPAGVFNAAAGGQASRLEGDWVGVFGRCHTISLPFPHPLNKKWNQGRHLDSTSVSMVRPAGFEPATYGFVVRRSIRAELRAQKAVVQTRCFISQSLVDVND